MIKIGASGTDMLFIEEGHKNFLEMPKWLREKFDLDVSEYSFNNGISISDEFAKNLGEQAKLYNIEMTAHAPYYINFGNPDATFEQKGINYILSSLKKLKLMGGHKLTIHLGSTSKQDRDSVIELITKRLLTLSKVLDEQNINDCMLCFEVMGKYTQIGNLEEIVEFAKLDKRFNLTLDVGHLNCLMQGNLKSEEDFEKVLNYIMTELPPEKYNNFHIHYSKIMFSEKGELKHLKMDDTEFGPEFEPLARAIKKKNLSPTIICESKDVMAQDAYKLKKIWLKTV